MTEPRDEEALFQAAVQLGAAERVAFLDRECAGDPTLRKRLETLLAAHDQPDTVFGTQATSRPTVARHPLHDLADDLVGQTIGRYKLLEKIGEGGCGVVYVAEQTEPVRRRVALKIIKLGMDTRQVVARFEAERQALAMMDHPNIAKFLDAGVTGSLSAPASLPASSARIASPPAETPALPAGRPYFVMELVRGIKITHYCDQEKLGTRARLELFIKVCQAIQHAHQKGIIHRDIKPSNILVTLHDGVPVPKVIDFGIAKATEGRLTDATVYTQLHQFIGTPAYMSPEQAAMSGLDIDTRSDIYSLGVLLYELLTGRTPFDAQELMSQGLDAMRKTIREKEPVRPSTRLRQSNLADASKETSRVPGHGSPIPRQGSLPSDLDWIVMKCLEKDRSRRYETANGLAMDLKRHLNHEPIVARPPSTLYRFQKAWRRHKLVFAAVCAVAAALILGTVFSVWQAKRATSYGRTARAAEEVARTNALMAVQARDLALREFERAESELWKSRLSEARALRIAGGVGARLGGAVLLHELVKRPNLTEAQVLALREEAIGQLALVDVGIPTNWVAKPSWHPLAWDAALERFVRHAAPDRLDLHEFPSERVLASFAAPEPATVEQARFTPDGRFLVVRFGNPGGHLWVWRVDTQEAVLRVHGVGQFDVLPDGPALVLPTGRGLVVQPLPPTTPWRRLQTGRTVELAAASPDGRLVAALPHDRQNVVELWETVAGEITGSFTADFHIQRMTWHPDGERLVIGGDRGRLELWTLEGERMARTQARPQPLLGHQGYVDYLHFAPDGSLLATYAWDGSSILWDTLSGRPLLREPRFHLFNLSTSGDRIRVRREWPNSESVTAVAPRNGFRTVAWIGKPLEVNSVTASPDGRLLAVAHNGDISGQEGPCSLWDLERGREVARVSGGWAQFSADSRTLHTFSRYAENCVRSYDVSAATLASPPPDWHQGRLVFQGRRGQSVNTGVLAPNGRELIVAATDSLVSLDLLNERPPQVLPKAAHVVALSPDARRIATMFYAEPAVIWGADGAPLFQAKPHSNLEFSPDGRWISVADQTEVRIHAADSLAPVHPPLQVEVPGVSPPVAFSRDGRMFAVALNRTHPRLFETATGRALAVLSPPHPGPITGHRALSFTHDGEWLLAGKNDGETVAWHLPTIRAELQKLGLDWTLTDAPAHPPSRTVAGLARPDFRLLSQPPPRDPATPPELIDLTPHYNAVLTGPWHVGGSANDLAELPRGIQTLADVRFDIRGLIQCGSVTGGGDPYPLRISGIAVGRPVRRLHFLHAAIGAFSLSPGLPIGRYTVRLADGSAHAIPLRIGHEVADWWAQPGEDLSQMEVAWHGQNGDSRRVGRSIRLFKTTWECPQPEVVIESLGVTATHGRAHPFLVAVTAE